uniref:HAD family hydrolase n=1 Tax=Thermodesulfobacterium geofontis TaxID=1295609 RepID=A0A7V6CE31_9BACT
MIKLVIFDLDDTLYPEIEFVKSGFRTVSLIISQDFGFDSNYVYNLLIEAFNENKKFVFNRVLNHFGIYNEDYLSYLVSVYRNHNPEIRLYKDAEEILPHLKKHFLLGLITDGNPYTQKIKVKALNIENYFDYIIYTGEKGDKYRKPSIYSFLDLINKFYIKPNESVYIGDNLEKDFKGPKDIGMFTIRIVRNNGIYRDSIAPSQDFEPDLVINSLFELIDLLKEF